MGGASVHLLDLATGAVSAGHKVAIYVGGKGVFLDNARIKRLPCIPVERLVRQISLVDDALCFFELRSKLKQYQPDIIHLHSSKAGLIGRLVAKSLGIRSVFTAHGWAFTEGVSRSQRKLYLFLERFMSRFANKIITVSEYDRRLALKYKVGDSNKLITIHNGMPNLMPDADIKAGGGPVRLIMVARFDEPKDQAALVRALSGVSAKHWHLELVGDGPSIEQVRLLVDDLGLGSKVTFSGARNDVGERLANSDVFCLISNWEGLPLTILEAMRGGLPVIASDVGGVAEAVVDRQTGYVVMRGDTAGITVAIEALLESEEDRTRFGKNGRLRYEEKFTFQVMLDKTLAVYEEILG
jgi:glycosyltransferase involved in cell wall biosynthesis